MLRWKLTSLLAAAAVGTAWLAPAQAVTVGLCAPGSLASGDWADCVDTFIVNPGEAVTLDLWADMRGIVVLSGSVDIALTGPLSLDSFVPSAFLLAQDALLSGFSSPADGELNRADNELEVHFGNFSGVTNLQRLGSLTVDVTGLGEGLLALSQNSFWGPWYDLALLTGTPTVPACTPIPDCGEILVDYRPASITAVPLPATAWLLLTGVGAMAARRFRRA